jgi:hypothetical protein
MAIAITIGLLTGIEPAFDAPLDSSMGYHPPLLWQRDWLKVRLRERDLKIESAARIGR